jgi:hypothetical protein
MEAATLIVNATYVLYSYLGSKACNSKHYEQLEPSELVLSAVIEMEIEGRRGPNVAVHIRQKFTEF